MSAPLPSALRTRFRKYIEEGLSGRAAAARLKVSPTTGARWALQIRAGGHAEPAAQGRPPGSGKLSAHQAFIEELVAQDPDITLFELPVALQREIAELPHQRIADRQFLVVVLDPDLAVEDPMKSMPQVGTA